MTYVRIYTDDAGDSHFEEVSVDVKRADFAPPAPPIQVASPVNANRVIPAVAPADWYGDWHPSPARQLWICLSGTLEAETSDGEKRTFGPGSVVLLEDTSGRGHRSKVVGGDPVTMMFVQLKEPEQDDH